MPDAAFLKRQIGEAFAGVEYSGDWCLRGSSEGEEPFLLEDEFKGKTDWRTLDARFIDQSPDGFGSALSFFSDEAFRFYLPAYLIADIDELLERADPVFHLCHGLDDQSRAEMVNPRRYGNRTWFDHAQHRFSMFTPAQAEVIANYLRFKRDSEGEFGADRITQALENYWIEHAQGRG